MLSYGRIQESGDMSINIESLIAITSDVRQGRPCIAGTKITVHRIAIWYKQGYTPEQIADEYEHLNLAQVYAALTYYHANQAEIETELLAENSEIEQLEQKHQQTTPVKVSV
jgi:uncharacterized protein (DUF433 family)